MTKWSAWQKASVPVLIVGMLLTQPVLTRAVQTDPTGDGGVMSEESSETTGDVIPTETPFTETVPTETYPAADVSETVPPTEPSANARALDGDIPVVSGQGISFRLFNYSADINKAAGAAAWRPISSYFTFRNSLMEKGTDAAAFNIPEPHANEAHDQDGFTKYHATVERVLKKGFPVLDLSRNADGTLRTDPGVSDSVRSLAYLFTSGDHAVTAYRPYNTILRQSGSHYWYNSAVNAVDYDAENNLFRLRSYVERNSTTAGYGSGYGDFLPFTYTGGIELGDSEGGIPYHVMATDTDCWFGMTMTVNFFQTKGGIISDQDMIFNFSGDDDVWVFVDDVLVLDLGGTHGTVDGSINFATGEVLQYLSWRGANSTDKERTEGSNTSFPTTIRACFDAAGRTPRGGWSANGQTFADFTEHTLKFFYLERGAAVANCMLDFRLPTLPDESLTVTKDLLPDADGQVHDFIADSLRYRFRVMKADSEGNATDEAFITEGTTFDLLENGSKNGTGTVDADGCFELKAGQSAQFTQMLHKGNGSLAYVVEEIMPDDLVGQYGSVEYLVSGAGGDTITEDDPAKSFTAFQTSALSAEQTHTVTFRNRVDTSKLCRLMVSKQAAPGTQISSEEVFQIQVKLGGSLLPVGTPYSVNGIPNTVETAGIVLLHADETAVLEQGILSGTAYEITELYAAENGYRPSYTGTVQPEGQIERSENMAAGIFPLAGTVHVTVTNADYDFAVQIPIQKTVLDCQESGEFCFLMERVVQTDGTWRTEEEFPDTWITVNGPEPVSDCITIGYQSGTEGLFYYRISEQRGGGNHIYDDTAYLVEVSISDDSAVVTRIWEEGGDDVDEIAFVNRATTSLTVTKIITGGTSAMKFPFTATVMLNGEPFIMPQPNSDAAYTVDGNVVSFSLGHGESITIPCIPIGAVVTVEEHESEGFEVFSRLDGIDDQMLFGNCRQIGFSNAAMRVEFMNQSGFRLPNTGSVGADLCDFSGAALCIGAGAALLYSYFARRKKHSSDL